MRKKALLAVADGTEELEAVACSDILRRAGIEVTIAAVGGRTVTASRGLVIVADRLAGECAGEIFDLIVLPGGMPGAENLRDCPALEKMLREQAGRGGVFAAICASPEVVLEHHGLLGSRRATGYPGMTGRFSNQEAVSEKVVVDGNCITGQGPGAALDFALACVSCLLGAGKAAEVAGALLVEPRSG